MKIFLKINPLLLLLALKQGEGNQLRHREHA
jgi:hypothetical protein